MEWLGDRLGLAVLREDESGASANAVARSLLVRESYPSLEHCFGRCSATASTALRIEESSSSPRRRTRELTGAIGERVLLSHDTYARAIAVLCCARGGLVVPPSRATNPDIAAGVSHELANALGAIADGPGWPNKAVAFTRRST